MNETIRLEMDEEDLHMQEAIALALRTDPPNWHRNLAIHLLRKAYKQKKQVFVLNGFLPSSEHTRTICAHMGALLTRVSCKDEEHRVGTNSISLVEKDPYEYARKAAYFSGETVARPKKEAHAVQCPCEGCTQAKLDAKRVHSLDSYLKEEEKAEEAKAIDRRKGSYLDRVKAAAAKMNCVGKELTALLHTAELTAARPDFGLTPEESFPFAIGDLLRWEHPNLRPELVGSVCILDKIIVCSAWKGAPDRKRIWLYFSKKNRSFHVTDPKGGVAISL